MRHFFSALSAGASSFLAAVSLRKILLALVTGGFLSAGVLQAQPVSCEGLNDCMTKGEQSGSRELALEYFSQGIEGAKAGVDTKKLAFALYIRGQKYMQAFNGSDATPLDRAEKDFQRSVSLDPGKFSAYSGLGIIAANRGQMDKAVEWMGKGVAADAKNPLSYFERGNFYMTGKQYEPALADFNSAINLLSGKTYDPKTQVYSMKVGVDLPPQQRVMLHVRRAQALRQLGRNDEALADMDAACALGEKRACP